MKQQPSLHASPSKDCVSLRLYFPGGARAKVTRIWHHLTAPSLAHHLLDAAKREHIHQALQITVNAGYLAGERMSYQHVETAPHRYPQCLELIDTERRLRAFLETHSDQLTRVKAVLFHCEIVRGDM